jgi:pyruvate/2-oxoglutarate dehydrogenase complex dihydrolipoamide dehydrogenase (E3) component
MTQADSGKLDSDHVDVVVIGMGPGGEDAASRLARAGLSVVAVDDRLVGGECPYYACIPTKMMVRAADALGEARRVNRLAGSAQVQPDWTPVATRIRDEATANWNDAAAVERFERAGGRFVRGRGRITGPGEVTVATSTGDQLFKTRKAILLNPGTSPAIPPIDGLAGTPFWTNREAVPAAHVPDSVVVLGGGPMGCEFAQIYARFGASVTVLQHGPQLLHYDEPEAAQVLAGVFEQEGIDVRTRINVLRVSHADGTFALDLDDGSTLTARQVLVAAGRKTDLPALGVAAVGIDESGRAIPVDEKLRAADGVWAIGDITGKGAFTHMSMYQARIAAADILGEEVEDADYRALPRVTFTDPEIAGVGLTAAEAKKAGLRVRTGSVPVATSTRGWIHSMGYDGLIKLVEDVDRGVLVGATVAGPAAGEVLGALAVAVHAEVPVTRLRQMIWAYPTFHRGIEAALEDLTG